MEEIIVEKVETRDNGCNCDCNKMKWHKMHKRGGGALYCLGVIGAAVYYIQNAVGFWAGVVGILKALVWPAFIVYTVLGFLKM